MTRIYSCATSQFAIVPYSNTEKYKNLIYISYWYKIILHHEMCFKINNMWHLLTNNVATHY
jgi:hypothetical protein